jgi:hypothetical protein
LSVLLRPTEHLDATAIERKRAQACHLNASVYVFPSVSRSSEAR